MAPFHSPVRRLLIAGGFVVAVAAAPAIAAVAVPSPGALSPQACAAGEEEDLFTGECIPHTVPNSPIVPAGATSGINGVPSVDGVPCEGHQAAQCRGLADEEQSEGPAAVPHASVDGQPLG
jgi:hypothetical protein